VVVMDEDLNMLMSMEDLQWEAFCQMLAKIGMITVFGMILAPVPNFLFCGLS